MNRMILSTLVLPSVLSLAQAGMAVGPKPMNPSVVLLAEAKQPVGLAEVALAAGKTHAALVAANGSATHAAMKESIHANFGGQEFVEAALRQGGTLEYAFKGNAPMTSQAPQITKAVEVDLTPAELSQVPAVNSVVLRAIVDEHGVPRNVQVTRSAGSIVDQKAIAALNQYRFTPASVDNQPTWSTVSVTIKIQK
jgi:TonB family protein